MTTTETIQNMTEEQMVAALTTLDTTTATRLEALRAEHADWLQRLQERAWRDADAHGIGSAADELMEQLGLQRRPVKVHLNVRASFQQQLDYERLPGLAQMTGTWNRAGEGAAARWSVDYSTNVAIGDEDECGCFEDDFTSLREFITRYPQFADEISERAQNAADDHRISVSITALSCSADECPNG